MLVIFAKICKKLIQGSITDSFYIITTINFFFIILSCSNCVPKQLITILFSGEKYISDKINLFNTELQ